MRGARPMGELSPWVMLDPGVKLGPEVMLGTGVRLDCSALVVFRAQRKGRAKRGVAREK